MATVKRNVDPARVSFGALKSSPPVDLKSDHSRPRPTEFDRFEQLTGALVKVPKSEIDEKREKS